MVMFTTEGTSVTLGKKKMKSQQFAMGNKTFVGAALHCS
jgi:hypothetical protein